MRTRQDIHHVVPLSDSNFCDQVRGLKANSVNALIHDEAVELVVLRVLPVSGGLEGLFYEGCVILSWRHCAREWALRQAHSTGAGTADVASLNKPDDKTPVDVEQERVI